MAESINFKIIQGDSFVLNAEYRDPQGNLINLSDHDVVFKVKDQFGGRVTCATASKSEGGVTSTDWTSGKFRVELTPAQTKKFTVPKAAYQLQIISNTTGLRQTLSYGIFSVEKGLM